MNPRRFVRTVLAPHHAEDAEFGKRRLAVAKKLLYFFVFIGSEPVLPEDLRGNGMSGSGHGEVILSHFAGAMGRAIVKPDFGAYGLTSG
jgi:hypothetical protein